MTDELSRSGWVGSDDQPKVAAPVRQEWMSDQEWAEFQAWDRWVADHYDVGYADPIAPGQMPLPLQESSS